MDCCISANYLIQLNTLTLKNQSSICPKDVEVWDAAYEEEYHEVMNLYTWDIISEQKYKELHKIWVRHSPPLLLAQSKGMNMIR